MSDDARDRQLAAVSRLLVNLDHLVSSKRRRAAVANTSSVKAVRALASADGWELLTEAVREAFGNEVAPKAPERGTYRHDHVPFVGDNA